ncbi:MAG: 5-oxoprolinase subunit PxpB [Synergistales bacterium]|nr:5-oxoprolinase subunit PxpB [Synergistales bacterium]
MSFRITQAGDSCLLVEFEERIAPETNARVHALREAVTRRGLTAVEELVPAYRSLAVYVDPLQMRSWESLRNVLEEIASTVSDSTPGKREGLVLPVLYGGEAGPDLDSVAENAALSPDEVVERHSAATYYCYMLGFTPGFPYLGGMDASIATPRLDSPRTRIPAGSVGIAGAQTGVYPVESPGGWRLIGRTPLALFDPDQSPPTLVQAGMWIRFRPVTREEWEHIDASVRQGVYQPDRFTGTEEEER